MRDWVDVPLGVAAHESLTARRVTARYGSCGVQVAPLSAVIKLATGTPRPLVGSELGIPFAAVMRLTLWEDETIRENADADVVSRPVAEMKRSTAPPGLAGTLTARIAWNKTTSACGRNVELSAVVS